MELVSASGSEQPLVASYGPGQFLQTVQEGLLGEFINRIKFFFPILLIFSSNCSAVGNQFELLDVLISLPDGIESKPKSNISSQSWG